MDFGDQVGEIDDRMMAQRRRGFTGCAVGFLVTAAALILACGSKSEPEPDEPSCDASQVCVYTSRVQGCRQTCSPDGGGCPSGLFCTVAATCCGPDAGCLSLTDPAVVLACCPASGC
jgi:hypothetical protein